MNSANSDTINSTRKSQSDQNPRRLVLKFRQRRVLIGESAKRGGAAGGPSGPVGSTSGMSSGTASRLAAGVSTGFSSSALTSTSHLPRLEVDARINPGVGQIGNQIHDKADEGENVEIGEHHRIIAVEHALEAQQSETVERENGFDQKRAGEKGADKRCGKPGDHQQHGITENVAVEHLPLAAALSARSQHILFAEFFEEGVFGQERHGGKRREPHGNNRQRQVPEIIENFVPPRKLLPPVGSESAQRKNLEERAAGKQNDEKDGEQKAGNGVTDNNHA